VTATAGGAGTVAVTATFGALGAVTLTDAAGGFGSCAFALAAVTRSTAAARRPAQPCTENGRTRDRSGWSVSRESLLEAGYRPIEDPFRNAKHRSSCSLEPMW
jgi:hypothetical protein